MAIIVMMINSDVNGCHSDDDIGSHIDAVSGYHIDVNGSDGV